MRSRVILVSGVCALLASCATVPPSFDVLPYLPVNQKVEYDHGRPFLVSTGDVSTVIVTPDFLDDRIVFMVSIFNQSEHDIEYRNSNVQALADGHKVAVVSAAELREEATKRANGQAVATAMLGAANQMNAAQAGRTTSYGTVNASAYGSGGYASGSANYQQSTYDASKALAAQSAARAETTQRMARIDAQQARAIHSIDTETLQRTTIHPNESVSGSITIEAPTMNSPKRWVGFDLVIGQDRHYIRFNEIQH